MVFRRLFSALAENSGKVGFRTSSYAGLILVLMAGEGLWAQTSDGTSVSGQPALLSNDYYSKTSSEAVLSFNGVYRMFVAGHIGDPPDPSLINETLRRLFLYMTGPLASGKVKAGTKDQDRWIIRHVTPVSGQPRFYDVAYGFSGVFAVEDTTTQSTIDVILPKDFVTIYKQAQDPAAPQGKQNPCTTPSAHYDTDEFFWYFWNPYRKGCKLRASIDYDIYKAALTPIPKELAPRHPDYPRLVDSKNKIKIYVFFGSGTDENGRRPPEANTDPDARNFLDVATRLVDLGFNRRRWSPQELIRFCPMASEDPQVVDEFARWDRPRQILVRLFWGITSTKGDNATFYCLLDDAVSSASVLIYNGHSGLGAALWLSDLRKKLDQPCPPGNTNCQRLPFHLNKNQLQIFAFNGCSSYRYYNQDFFDEKRVPTDPYGTRNLQIINNGIEGDFSDLSKLTLGVIEPILDWSRSNKWTSYQQMLDRIGSEHLTGVNGLSGAVSAPH